MAHFYISGGDLPDAKLFTDARLASALEGLEDV